MARKNSIVSVTVNDDKSLTFTVDGAGSFDLNPANLSLAIRERAELHGLVQKVSDAAAIPKADLSGDAVADAKTKFERMEAVRNSIVAGDWSKRSGDGSGPVAGIILAAYREFVANAAAAKKVPAPSAEMINDAYAKMDKKAQLALRRVPEIAAIMERIKSERGADSGSTVDVDALLSGLGI